MNILVISQQIPYPLSCGAALLIYNIFKKLAQRHEIYLLCFSKNPEDRQNLKFIKDIFTNIYLIESEGEKRSPFRYLKNVLSWNSGFLMKEQQPKVYQRFKEKMIEVVFTKNIDLLYCHSLYMAEFAFDIKECKSVLNIVDSVKLELQRRIQFQSNRKLYERLKTLIWYYRFSNFEKKMLESFDLNITVGEKDFEVLNSLSPMANIELIPNGVDTDYFYPSHKKSLNYPMLIFSGNMNFSPNVDAAMFFYHNIFPLIKKKMPDVHFFVVGRSPVNNIKKLSKDKNIVVTGFVEDMITYINKADVVICPMRMGGGIKNKILEAMALGKAIVSTSIGVEGIDVIQGENIMIADSPTEFAENVLKLLNDQSLRNRIANNACVLINERYTWDKCSRRYEELYVDLLSNRQAGKN